MSASISTAASAAPTSPAQVVLTSARSARAQSTGPSSARPEPPWIPVTPLKVDRWHSTLADLGLLDEFLDIIDGLENGFPLHSSLSIDTTRIYDNHKSALQHPEIIEGMIDTELTAGRFIGPFDKEELECLIGPFVTHPLGLAPKSDGTWRLVEDLSFPRSGPYPH
jgi:hypothetical protein